MSGAREIPWETVGARRRQAAASGNSGMAANSTSQSAPGASLGATRDRIQGGGTASNVASTPRDTFETYGTSQILNMSAMDRKALGEGPKITIFIGDKPIIQLPRRLFEAAATDTASELLNGTSEVHLSENINEDAAMYFLEWLSSCPQKNDFVRIRWTNKMEQDLHMCKMSRELGMDFFTAHAHRHYWSDIKKITPGPEEILAIENLGAGDPFIDCVGSRLAYLVRQGQFPEDELEGFYKFVRTCTPLVYAQMQSSDQVNAKRLDDQARHRALRERAAQLPLPGDPSSFIAPDYPYSGHGYPPM